MHTNKTITNAKLLKYAGVLWERAAPSPNLSYIDFRYQNLELTIFRPDSPFRCWVQLLRSEDTYGNTICDTWLESSEYDLHKCLKHMEPLVVEHLRTRPRAWVAICPGN